ncbi:hypothetical protein GBAR_LOCUS25764 [Geodia barretti]|uniref:Uncharacterized protein n=1 Tax=Geodia barretti TaxID=519541 RepID=A0AA35XCN0_GEOBA|nr:hypothetical protein GBAR_LOCUS25764 [Geodia barretti]
MSYKVHTRIRDWRGLEGAVYLVMISSFGVPDQYYLPSTHVRHNHLPHPAVDAHH